MIRMSGRNSSNKKYANNEMKQNITIYYQMIHFLDAISELN